MSITYSECASVALFMKHAKRMRCIILSSVACLAVSYFSTLPHKRHDLRKKLPSIKYVFWFSLQRLTETFVILRRTERNIIINVHRPSCKIPVIFCQFLFKLEFCRQIFEKYSNIKFHRNPSIGSRIVPCRRMDMTNVIVAFRNIANAPKNNRDIGRICGSISTQVICM